MLEQMGFTQSQATKALKQTDNDIERAADWLFSHQSELDAMEVEDVHVEDVQTVAVPVAVDPSNVSSSKYIICLFFYDTLICLLSVTSFLYYSFG